MALRAIITLDFPEDISTLQHMISRDCGLRITEDTEDHDYCVVVEPDLEVKIIDQQTPVTNTSEALVKLSALINEARNSDDEIDQTYLLEAVVNDIDAMAQGNYGLDNVIYLLDNPVS